MPGTCGRSSLNRFGQFGVANGSAVSNSRRLNIDPQTVPYSIMVSFETFEFVQIDTLPRRIAFLEAGFLSETKVNETQLSVSPHGPRRPHDSFPRPSQTRSPDLVSTLAGNFRPILSHMRHGTAAEATGGPAGDSLPGIEACLTQARGKLSCPPPGQNKPYTKSTNTIGTYPFPKGCK